MVPAFQDFCDHDRVVDEPNAQLEEMDFQDFEASRVRAWREDIHVKNWGSDWGQMHLS